MRAIVLVADTALSDLSFSCLSCCSDFTISSFCGRLAQEILKYILVKAPLRVYYGIS